MKTSFAEVIVLALMTNMFAVQTLYSQSASSDPLPVQPNIRKMYLEGYQFKLGELCKRMTKNEEGVIKRDGCGRWYCGRTSIKDILEVRPNFAQEMGCVWRLRGDHCFCQNASGKSELVPEPGQKK